MELGNKTDLFNSTIKTFNESFDWESYYALEIQRERRSFWQRVYFDSLDKNNDMYSAQLHADAALEHFDESFKLSVQPQGE